MLKIYMKYLCLALCMAFSAIAFAQTVPAPTIDLSASWNAPTAREDGTPLAASEIAAYDLQYRRVADANYQSIRVLGSLKTVVIKGVPSGSYEARIATIDTQDLRSGFVTLNLKYTSPPKPPADFKFIFAPSSSQGGAATSR